MNEVLVSPASPPTYTEQRSLIQTALSAGVSAAQSLALIVPHVDMDRTEYALASLMLEEAWVGSR